MLESYLAIPPLLGVFGLLVALGIYIVVTRFLTVKAKTSAEKHIEIRMVLLLLLFNIIFLISIYFFIGFIYFFR